MPDLPLERNTRLKLEEERLRALSSFMFELRSFDKSDGASGVLRYNEREIPITIHYGLDFPFMRPTLWTEDEDVKSYRHVNRAGEICTLRYQPDEWEPDDLTAADLVRRAWTLIANEGVLDKEEDDQLPISLDFQLGAKSPLLIVPEGALLGEAIYGTTALQRSRTFVEGLALTTLKDERGSVIWSQTQDEQLNGRYTMDGKLIGALWFVATTPPPKTLKSLEDLKDLLPAGVPRTYFDGLFKGLKTWQSRQSFILVHFHDESGPRWALVLDHSR